MLEFLTNKKGKNQHGLRNQAKKNLSKTLSGGQEPHRRREGRLVGAKGFEDIIKTWLTESRLTGDYETEVTIRSLV